MKFRSWGPSRNTQILLCAYEGAADAAIYLQRKTQTAYPAWCCMVQTLVTILKKSMRIFLQRQNFFSSFFRMNWYCYLKNLIALGHIKHSEIPRALRTSSYRI